jgi:hypothetical protein
MKITSLDIVGQLERLAEACPWDTVNIWVTRTPEGKYSFTGYVHENEKFGFKNIFSSGATPEEAVDEAIKRTGDRAPDVAIAKAVSEMQEKIAKLQAVVVGLPPYRANRELSNGEPAISAQRTVDV